MTTTRYFVLFTIPVKQEGIEIASRMFDES